MGTSGGIVPANVPLGGNQGEGTHMEPKKKVNWGMVVFFIGCAASAVWFIYEAVKWLPWLVNLIQ